MQAHTREDCIYEWDTGLYECMQDYFISCYQGLENYSTIYSLPCCPSSYCFWAVLESTLYPT